MTQEEANAIAEMEYPYDDNMFDRDIKRYRIAYVKCLMDMNPLIEAGEKLESFVLGLQQRGVWATTSLYEKKSNDLMSAFRTALSNLTKNIEP